MRFAKGKMGLKEQQVRKFRNRLLDMQSELTSLSEISAESRKPVQLDQTSVGRLSRMDALQGQAMQLETERRRNAELHRIEAALQRIRDGEFGYCCSCGDDIALKRLEHDPSVPNCVDCASS